MSIERALFMARRTRIPCRACCGAKSDVLNSNIFAKADQPQTQTEWKDIKSNKKNVDNYDIDSFGQLKISY